MIFSLFAKSRALSNGILLQCQRSGLQIRVGVTNIPDALEVHWTNFHNMPHLFAFQYSVSSASGHTCNVEQFGTVDHVIVYNSVSLATCKAQGRQGIQTNLLCVLRRCPWPQLGSTDCPHPPKALL